MRYFKSSSYTRLGTEELCSILGLETILMLLMMWCGHLTAHRQQATGNTGSRQHRQQATQAAGNTGSRQHRQQTTHAAGNTDNAGTQLPEVGGREEAASATKDLAATLMCSPCHHPSAVVAAVDTQCCCCCRYIMLLLLSIHNAAAAADT